MRAWYAQNVGADACLTYACTDARVVGRSIDVVITDADAIGARVSRAACKNSCDIVRVVRVGRSLARSLCIYLGFFISWDGAAINDKRNYA